MKSCAYTYIAHPGIRKAADRFMRTPGKRTIMVVLAAGLLLGGCSFGGGIASIGADNITTGTAGSAAHTFKPDSIEDSDWAQIQRIVAEAAKDENAGTPVPWKNEESGASGSLMAFAEPRDGRGNCRTFATTLQDVSGIHRYRGEACKGGNDRWSITHFESLDQL